MLKIPISRKSNLTVSQTATRHWGAELWKTGRTIFLVLVVPWFAPRTLTSEGSNATGKVEGTAFVGDAGHRSYVAGAKIVASGPVTLETETNGEGRYAFVAVPPGNYTVKANFPGLEGEQSVLVEARRTVQIELELRPEKVNDSVTVRASDADGKTPETVDAKTLRDAPNVDERFESLLPLVPGVVRGPDGHINLKGTRNTQSGALVNSANVTDPATGSPAINIPIDVVSSVQVISNPYDPEYGKLTGAVSTTETKTGNYEKYHFSIQNVLPRLRDRDGSIAGIGAATPRMTLTGPIIKDRIAFTQSFEYRFIRTPVNSLPPLQRDTKLESFNSYTQSDLTISPKQTATLSLTIYPQKLDYMGLNTFTPQPSTADFHQRGYQIYGQHRYLAGSESALISQFNYKTYDADITAQNDNPYQLLVDTTDGGYFNRQARRTYRFEWQESYQFAPRQFLGSHQLKAGLNYAHSSYNGRETFLPVEIIGASGAALERITFTQPTAFSIDQNETSWFVANQWAPFHRLTFNLGMRFDNDTVTSSTHMAPRLGFLLALTSDGKTLLKGGVGLFYDRVPLMLPIFEQLPNRTVSMLDTNGQVSSSTFYLNRITGGLENPRSTAWNVAVERQVTEHLAVRAAYEQRNTVRDFVVAPNAGSVSGVLALSHEGSDSYREFQVTGRYQVSRLTLNSSYVHSRAYGNLNDPALFFGNYPQAVIQPDARARLPFDAPNRFLLWADIAGPWKLTLLPVYDLHTGFPYSVENELREYIGPRNTRRFPRFSSMDLQVSRPFSLHAGERHHLQVRAGFGVFNVFNHFNPRDVQNDVASNEFGGFFNDAWREYRGKFVFQF
jgi:Carboxypeptidase regulatory-like domain